MRAFGGFVLNEDGTITCNRNRPSEFAPVIKLGKRYSDYSTFVKLIPDALVLNLLNAHSLSIDGHVQILEQVEIYGHVQVIDARENQSKPIGLPAGVYEDSKVTLRDSDLVIGSL